MSLVVNYNGASQQAQNSLRQTQSQLNQSIERLSSGNRINSAKDDAAGQAIANRISAQVNGLNQASNNANDGISLAQTTEGALNQINNNVQRIRELSVQAANGTNSQSDLNSIQAEINQRSAEIDRVSQQTSFNGVKVLDGSTDSVSIQVGAKDGQTIEIGLQQADSGTLGIGDLNVNGYSGSLSAAVVNDGDGNDVVANGTVNITDAQGNSVTGSLQQDADGGLFVDNGSGDVYAVTNTDVTTGPTGDGSDSTVDVTVDTTQSLSAKTDGPLATLDSALTGLNNARSDLGAVQNRFDSAINNIASTKTNLASAKSRIVDTNYANEVSQLSKAKILNQAGQSVLAQANQTQQGVLSLLRNA